MTQLQECLDSVTKSSFPISQITFVLVVDGLVTPDNQLLNATNSALSALKNKSTHEPHPLAYTSLGEGLKRTNYAKIYSGIFSKYGGENFGIPYVLIEKIGNSYEDDDPIPGNRGKLDSLALIYKFLNNVL